MAIDEMSDCFQSALKMRLFYLANQKRGNVSAQMWNERIEGKLFLN